MDCFQDFCLYCDRDSPDGAYCSQQCKLADLEKSNPSSPTSLTSSAPERTWQPSHYNQYQTPTYGAPTSSSRPRSSYFMWPSQQQEHTDERQLTPSSSRTSLSSTSSASSMSASATFTKDARAQLHDYFSSFDQARAAKRRSSLR